MSKLPTQAWNKAKISPHIPLKNALSKRENHSTNDAFWLVESRDARRLADDISRSLRDGKKYLETEYQKNCKDNESSCPDHCRTLGLSDLNDPNFQEKCTHEHTLSCPQCDDITSCLHKLQQTVRNSESFGCYCTLESPCYESCKPGTYETRYTSIAWSEFVSSSNGLRYEVLAASLQRKRNWLAWQERAQLTHH